MSVIYTNGEYADIIFVYAYYNGSTTISQLANINDDTQIFVFLTRKYSVEPLYLLHRLTGTLPKQIFEQTYAKKPCSRSAWG